MYTACRRGTYADENGKHGDSLLSLGHLGDCEVGE
jgi:hypothetical protein